ncbi:response regulator containing a CheY-like receiver domain and an HTH DNA-binding domain [Longilinea arvoryzae]|uniref:Response regulator containing a CheY-like receiver domain and an HTH DNA-binding domain n=1 Tax=Longilinea arvoryzae TaxID=360412 RepID=A0A0S7BA28_9CHLR|nr:LuxR C-terminal-related transcriptional regulator [Longilinea arvoryzae]GAP14327.1 response regulator containing a CheY-like receiver domain and an HTH DNA-binding domain [Longilinea arvoryzae]
MDAWHLIWHDLQNWLHRKRLFAMDLEAYRALHLVAERQQRSPGEVASQLFEQAAQEQDAQAWTLRCWEHLSPRQKQITAHICRGDSNRQMALQLNISQTTVKSHVEIILRKFGVGNRVALRVLLSPWDLSAYL